mmetsp:Transcript_43871/g.103296  ORF Transcript_43871/g.103296 Transcript_43871/m.103296 type:complete len:184 (+) Transcript_43871:24-575(+)
MAGVSAQVGVGFGSMSLTLLVLVCMGMVGLLPSASAFSTGAALPLRQGASACKNAQKASLRPTTAARLFMQEQSPKEDEDKSSIVDTNLSTLNSRIQKMKERESNIIYNIQDKITDSVEPLQMDAKKFIQNVPDPRAAIPVTGLPKWVLPLGVIVGLSVISAVLQSSGGGGGNVGSGLATGSL